MVMRRLAQVFRAKAKSGVQPDADPFALLEQGFEQQVDLLRDVKRAVVEVTAARRRLELQAEDLRERLPGFEDQAREALAAGDDARARRALARGLDLQRELATFDEQIEHLRREEERLVAAERRLQQRVDAFRTRKEVLGARYTAARATARVGEAVSGLSEEMADVGFALQRAEQHTALLRARGRAIDELMAEGLLEDPLGSERASWEAEFARLDREPRLQAQLEALRRQLPGAPAHTLPPGERR